MALLALAATVLAQGFPRKVDGIGELEGSSRPGDKGTWRTWTSNVKMGPLPDAATRATELKARKEAVAADIARLKARLKLAPDAATQGKIRKVLDELVANRGLAGTIPRAMSVPDLESMRAGQAAMPKGLLDAFIQFKRDLDSRGVDLIVMPAPPDCSVYMHLLVDGLKPDTEVWPGWTQMQLELLENDVEVIDTLDQFRASARDPVAIMFPNDPHTGSQGRRIMGKVLAERLQRYDFARALVAERGKWTWTTKTHPGNEIFSGTLYFSKAWDYLKEFNGREQAPTVAGRTVFRSTGRDGKPVWATPKNEAMVPGLKALRESSFQYLTVKAALPKGDELSRMEMVFIGDSQLHSAVHGDGLPTIVGAEVGGVFRWASKSWGNFDAPGIYYHMLCPDDQPQPRVVVLFFLPFKFNQHVDAKGNPVDAYKPRPMPPYRKGAAPAVSGLPAREPFEASIKITAVSQQKDPKTVQYKEALTRSAAVIVGGPYDGKVIGVQYWTMYDRGLIKPSGAVQVGQQMKVTLQPWGMAIASDSKLKTIMVYDDTDQALTVPVFWITRGDLAPDVLLPKAPR